MADPFTIWTQVLGLGQTTLKIAQFLFSVKEGDIQVCHTRIIRVKRGLPWNEQIGVHPLEDGRLILTPIREKPRKVSRRTKK